MGKLTKSLRSISSVQLTVISLAAFLLLYIYVFLDSSSILCVAPVQKFLNQSSIKNPSNLTIENNKMPIMLNHGNVLNTTVYYTIRGEVEKLSQSALQLKSVSSPLPAFVITPETPVFKMEQDKKTATPAKFADLRVGLNVIVVASYNFSQKTWIVNRITISGANSGN